ncbi:hypothetical protein AB0C38_24970 [Amycolatopsis sp. NPDC048633]|uniref:AMP-binding enzyme n=1 Tax=Amycolatopsis sp. NPDC048633 TaxID=3157095 RepID=UPI0033EE686B
MGSIVANIVVGGTVVIHPLGAFDPKAVLDAYEREGATVVFNVPQQWDLLCAQPDIGERAEAADHQLGCRAGERRDAAGHGREVPRRAERGRVRADRDLADHPSVRKVAVLGRPDERWGQVPVAFVALAPEAGLSLRELTGFLDGKLASFKMPKDLVVVPGLPRNAGGKVDKGLLRAQDVTLAGTVRPE